MKTIIVLSRKGGTGKTTTVHALGSWLMKKGKRVLFVDMDGQANLTLTFGAKEKAINSFDLMMGSINASKAIQHTAQGDIIAGNELLHALDKKLKGRNDIYVLSKALVEVKSKYDYCIIDTPAALGMATLNSIIAADKIVVPVQADLYSVQGISRIIETLETIKDEFGEKRKIDGFLVTRFNSRTAISKSILNDLEKAAEHYKTRVYKTTIRECTALKEAELMQQSIFDYAPRSNGAADYESFIKELMK